MVCVIGRLQQCWHVERAGLPDNVLGAPCNIQVTDKDNTKACKLRAVERVRGVTDGQRIRK